MMVSRNSPLSLQVQAVLVSMLAAGCVAGIGGDDLTRQFAAPPLEVGSCADADLNTTNVNHDNACDDWAAEECNEAVVDESGAVCGTRHIYRFCTANGGTGIQECNGTTWEPCNTAAQVTNAYYAECTATSDQGCYDGSILWAQCSYDGAGHVGMQYCQGDSYGACVACAESETNASKGCTWDEYDPGVEVCPDGEDDDGDGVVNEDDDCCQQYALTGDGCPGSGLEDPDNDGVANDQCPYSAEDFDGVEDGDGCPEADGPSGGGGTNCAADSARGLGSGADGTWDCSASNNQSFKCIGGSWAAYHYSPTNCGSCGPSWSCACSQAGHDGC